MKLLLAIMFLVESFSAVTPIDGSDTFARLSDDGKQVLQCAFKDGKQQSVLFDVNNTIGERISEFDGYSLSPDGTKMLIWTNSERIYRHSFAADYYIYTIRSRKLERLSDGGKQQAAQFSPDGNQVAFVRDNNLFICKLLYDNAEVQITKDGAAGAIINGAPDWVNEEEFGVETAFCFTADGARLCWLRYDESRVPIYPLARYDGTTCTTYEYKYPVAGEQNATVTAWTYDIKSRKTQQMQVPMDADGYMPRLLATDDPDRVMVYTMNRHQDGLSIYTVNPSTTLAQLVVKEQADCYVPEDVIHQTLIVGNTLLVPSDRTGYMHLYLYNLNGQLLRSVGEGTQIVTDVYGYDETTGDVYYQLATTPQNRQVAVSHKNGKVDILAGEDGWNSAIFSADNRYFINTHSTANSPYTVTLRNNTGKTLATPIDNASTKAVMAREGRGRREFFTFTTSEGVALNGWMLKPPAMDANKRYPVVMYQYSGPGSQQVINSWRCGSMGQAFDYELAEKGYIVVCVDGRGTGGRGAQFEKQTYLNLGRVEARDQVETAQWLARQSYVDGNRIGIWGWSYGGFNTLMAMSESTIFKCGVAVAPPTSWRFYDTIYTERYMRTPQENASGYDYSPLTRASQLSGDLLIVHGLMDDNVHPQNTFEYTAALVEADKDFRELIYTNKNHSIYGGNARKHVLRQVSDWMEANLK